MGAEVELSGARAISPTASRVSECRQDECQQDAPISRVEPRASVPRRDIANRDDLAMLLTDFYGRAFGDDLLGPVFVDIAQMDLAAHLPVICDFWETVLFHGAQYRRNALVPHLRLHATAHLTPAHFDRWLMLWLATVDDRHLGPTAERAKLQATRIAGSMSRRITGLPREGAVPIVSTTRV